MKTFYKLLSFSLIIFLILNIFAFSASAADVVIDGTISTNEWENAESFVVLESKSSAGNNIDFAEIKALRKGDNTVYLALTAVDTTDEYLDDCGMQITIPSVGVYSFGSDNSSDFQPNNAISIDYESTADLSDTFFIELELVFKKAVKEDLTFKLQVKDNTGVLSNESEITVKYVQENNYEQVETTNNNSSNSTSTTKFRNESTTKFSATEKNPDADKSGNSSEPATESTSAFIAKTDSEKTSVSKITRIVLSVLAAVLIVAAGALLIFARPTEKKQDKKSKNEEISKEDK